MKTVDEIIHEIEKNNRLMGSLLTENRQLAKELKERPVEDWDWIPVATACKLWDISPAKLYQKINAGKLQTKRFDSKIYVSKSEVIAINDKVV